jgi:hypothetical protein
VIDAVGIADECVGEAAEIEQAKNEEFRATFRIAAGCGIFAD